jgi:hypothetical protein
VSNSKAKEPLTGRKRRKTVPRVAVAEKGGGAFEGAEAWVRRGAEGVARGLLFAGVLLFGLPPKRIQLSSLVRGYFRSLVQGYGRLDVLEPDAQRRLQPAVIAAAREVARRSAVSVGIGIYGGYVVLGGFVLAALSAPFASTLVPSKVVRGSDSYPLYLGAVVLLVVIAGFLALNRRFPGGQRIVAIFHGLVVVGASIPAAIAFAMSAPPSRLETVAAWLVAFAVLSTAVWGARYLIKFIPAQLLASQRARAPKEFLLVDLILLFTMLRAEVPTARTLRRRTLRAARRGGWRERFLASLALRQVRSIDMRVAVNAGIVATLERIAVTLEQDVGKSIRGGDPTTDAWVDETVRRQAAWFRALKRDLLLPGSDATERMKERLAQTFEPVANGEWGLLVQDEIAAPRRASLARRARGLVAFLVTAALPLAILLLLSFVDYELPAGLEDVAKALATLWALVTVLVRIDPKFESKMAIMKGLGELGGLPRAGLR